MTYLIAVLIMFHGQTYEVPVPHNAPEAQFGTLGSCQAAGRKVARAISRDLASFHVSASFRCETL